MKYGRVNARARKPAFKKRPARKTRLQKLIHPPDPVAPISMESVRRRVQYMPKIESKYLHTTNNNAIDNTPATYSQWLSAVSQGDDRNGRTGLTITSKYISINWHAACGYITATGVFVPCVLRFIVLLDKECRANAAVLPSMVDTHGVASTIDSRINTDGGAGDRFVVLKDVRICLNANRPDAVGKINISLKNAETSFNAPAAATYANAIKNQVIVVAVSNVAIVAGQTLPNLAYDYKYTFMDA